MSSEMEVEGMDPEQSPAAGPYYTTHEFARIVRVHPATVRTWRHRGYGPTPWIPMGGQKLIRVADAHAWLAAQEEAAGAVA